MKRILILTLVFVSLATFASATIKLETETWFDYNQLLTPVATAEANPLLNPGGNFFIGRAYFTLSGDLGTDFYGDPIKERVTFDFANAVTNSAAGIIKYAYFDYDLLKIGYSTSSGNTVNLNTIVFSAGLQPVYFANLAFWQYPLPIKDASELYTGMTGYGLNQNNITNQGGAKGTTFTGVTNYTGIRPTTSADFGFMLSGRLLPIEGLTSSLISYYLQFLNGDSSGYKSLFDNNAANGAPYNKYWSATNWNTFAYQASVFISPLDGTMIGGTYRYVPYDATLNMNTETSFGLLLAAKNVKAGDITIPIDLEAEWINLNSTNTAYTFEPASATSYSYANDFNGVVYSVTLGYGLFDWMVEPVIRYDYFNPNTETTNGNNVSGSILYIGGSIKLDANNLTMKPLVGIYLTENGAPSQNFLVWLEFAYKLNFTIWQ